MSIYIGLVALIAMDILDNLHVGLKGTSGATNFAREVLFLCFAQFYGVTRN